jgi:trans-2-enoyl-CoA reductase
MPISAHEDGPAVAEPKRPVILGVSSVYGLMRRRCTADVSLQITA